METTKDLQWWESRKADVTAIEKLPETIDLDEVYLHPKPPRKNNGVEYWTAEELFPGVSAEVITAFTLMENFKGLYLLDVSVPCSEADLSEISLLSSVCILFQGIAPQNVEPWLVAFPECRLAVEVLATHNIILPLRDVSSFSRLRDPARLRFYGATVLRGKKDGTRARRRGLSHYYGCIYEIMYPIGVWAYGDWIFAKGAGYNYPQWHTLYHKVLELHSANYTTQPLDTGDFDENQI